MSQKCSSSNLVPQSDKTFTKLIHSLSFTPQSLIDSPKQLEDDFCTPINQITFPLKSSKNLRFSDDFRGGEKLINSLKYAQY